MMSAGLRPTGSGAVAVPAATTPRAGAERFIHDAPDGGGAASTLRAASQAAIDLGRRARRRVSDGGTHLDVGEHVAGAHDHGVGHGLEGDCIEISISATQCKRKFYFQFILI